MKHLESGETEEAAVVREVFEELGVRTASENLRDGYS